MAYWLKRSSRFSSFRSIARSGSKCFTSPAIRTGQPVASNLVMGPMPERPLRTESQVVGTSCPHGLTHPSPVMTTRFTSFRSLPSPARGMARLLSSGWEMLVDVVDGVLDGGDLLGVFVRDLDVEFLLDQHDQLDDVEAVGPEVVDERSIGK